MNFQSQFNKLKWGFIFIFINIPISFGKVKIDIMPDIVGYILFAIALNDLSQYNDNFQSAKTYNIAAAVLSIFLFITKEIEGLNVIISIISLIVELKFVYNTLMGVGSLAERFNDSTSIGYKADEIWYKYKWFIGLCIGSVLFALILGPLVIILLGVILIYGIYMVITIIGFINDCGKLIVNNEA